MNVPSMRCDLLLLSLYATDATARWRFDALKPATRYRYELCRGDTVLAAEKGQQFTTAAPPDRPAASAR